METVDALLTSFFARDDLDALTAQAGAMLGCPILILDDTFHVFSSYCPLDFTDALFRKTLLRGELTFEVSAAISQSQTLAEGTADFVRPEGSQMCIRDRPNSLDPDAKINIIPVTVQRKALKSIKTAKFGKNVSLLDWNGYQGQGFFLPMSEQVFKRMDRNKGRYFTVTLQGSNDNRNFASIPTVGVSGQDQHYYPLGISYNMEFLSLIHI